MWRLVHNRSSSVQTYRSFNRLIINHLKDFILDDIQTINFLPSRLYYDSVQIAVTEEASSRFDCEQSLPFLLRHFRMRTRTRGERRSREKRGGATISPSFLHLYAHRAWLWGNMDNRSSSTSYKLNSYTTLVINTILYYGSCSLWDHHDETQVWNPLIFPKRKLAESNA